MRSSVGPLESARLGTQRGSVSSFVIASLLLFVSFVTLVATMLVLQPQKVDAFLNSDQPVENTHVVTGSK
jgi:hypothetical protein